MGFWASAGMRSSDGSIAAMISLPASCVRSFIFTFSAVRSRWLGHADARQVSDLPARRLFSFAGLRPALAVPDRQFSRASVRQVTDLPRIGMAKPSRGAILFLKQLH